MTIHARESTPKRATPSPLTRRGIVTTATPIGDNWPRRFHKVFSASSRPPVRFGMLRVALIEPVTNCCTESVRQTVQPATKTAPNPLNKPVTFVSELINRSQRLPQSDAIISCNVHSTQGLYYSER